MPEFLAALQAFPNVVFTGLFGLMLLYWLSVILGALDLELFSPDAAGHAHDVDMAPGGHETPGIFEFLSLGRVPITITLSVFVLIAWALGMFAEINLRPMLSGILPAVAYQALILIAQVLVAGVAAAYAVRPLRLLFTTDSDHGEEGLVGKMVRITSLKATAAFGTAICDNAGPGILLQVICRDGVEFKRDDMAVVVDYDATKSLYLIAPFSHVNEVDALAGGALPVLPPPREAPAGSTAAPPVSLERQAEPPH